MHMCFHFLGPKYVMLWFLGGLHSSGFNTDIAHTKCILTEEKIPSICGIPMRIALTNMFYTEYISRYVSFPLAHVGHKKQKSGVGWGIS